tara:strand:- start:4015 stop:5520 length:1506 start_codon:yes stop_codon:yes gene_type:complete
MQGNDKFGEFLKDVKTLAIVCNQWGDTGKGKFVDYFSEWADIIARGTGGANAGHTILINGKKFVFHIVPSGIIHDFEGKINIIGKGVAFEPRVVKEELDVLDKAGLSYKNLKIAYNAKLVLPQHMLMDRIKEADSGSKKIGTTGRGIGPVYADYVSRVGLSVNDMLNKEVLVKKIKKNLAEKIKLLRCYDKEAIKEIMHHPHLSDGRFYSEEEFFDVNAIAEEYYEYGKFFKDMICDTDKLLKDVLGRKRILLEGAQGILLSVEHGSYPYVTSSDPSIQGLTKGVGLDEKDVDLVLGIVKAFYMTRVGKGPFPTELGGERSEEWCNTHTRADEEKEYGGGTVNSSDEFEQGVGIRFSGSEYGATTGRPRRTGWLDLPLLRNAIKVNGSDVILTKLDVLDGCKIIKVCMEYEYDGDDYFIGEKVFRKGDRINVGVPDVNILKHCRPIYKEFPGWESDITKAKCYDELPENLKKIIDFVWESVGVNAKMISVGPEREQTIFKE